MNVEETRKAIAHAVESDRVVAYQRGGIDDGWFKITGHWVKPGIFGFVVDGYISPVPPDAAGPTSLYDDECPVCRERWAMKETLNDGMVLTSCNNFHRWVTK